MRKDSLFCLFIAILLFHIPFQIKAQEKTEDNSFGGWHFVEISHTFKDTTKWSCLFYFEHENYQYRRLDCCFVRAKVGYKVLPWLKLGLGYDFVGYSTTYGHRIVAEVSGTLKRGGLSASTRIRYLHTWKPELGTQDNELRTLLRVQYSFSRVPVKPYVAVEIFTWGSQWRKSRHYVGCMYDITRQLQIEGFYMLTFSSKNPEHILGLGLNFTI